MVADLLGEWAIAPLVARDALRRFEVTLVVDVLRAEDFGFVSPGAVALPRGEHAALARDPTGHLLLLCE
jgi:hypothetical protein